MRRGQDKNAALLEAIELFYESVTAPGQWVEALDRTYELFDSMAAHFFFWNSLLQKPEISIGSRTYGGQQEVIDYYLRIDPRRIVLARQPLGYTMLCHEHIDEAFVHRNEFFQDYSLRFGRRYLMATSLVQNGPSTAVLALMRSPQQEPFSSYDSTLLERLRPHLVRVARMQKRFEQLRAEATLGHDLLNTMQVCIFVADTEARILHMNSAAEAILRKGDVLRSMSGRLVAAAYSQTATLHRLIKHATGVAGGVSGRSMIMDGRQGTRHGLTVMPLSRRAVPLNALEIPLALVTISSLETPARPNQQILEMFGLTTAESELAAAVAAGKRLDDIAKERGVRMTTVRTQMRAIYSKTGTNRQAELAQMIARVPMSWASG